MQGAYALCYVPGVVSYASALQYEYFSFRRACRYGVSAGMRSWVYAEDEFRCVHSRYFNASLRISSCQIEWKFCSSHSVQSGGGVVCFSIRYFASGLDVLAV